MAVLFSGISFYNTPESFDLPDFGDRERNFVQFGLAAIGESLDSDGSPPFTPSGVSASRIECFSGQFESWSTRQAASEDEIQRHVEDRLYWDWRFGHTATLITSHDLLRLRATIRDIERIAELEVGRLWTVMAKSKFGVSLVPTPELLRRERDRRQGAAVTSPIPRPASPPTGQTATPQPSTPSPAPTVDKDSAGKDEPKPSARKRSSKAASKRQTLPVASHVVFVDDARLADLRAITHTDFDLRKLLAICDELNICYRSQCHFAVAALTRALLDHIPPVFGMQSFGEVANNHAGARSFREAMQHLDKMARKIADGHLHTQIRKKESLPTRTQVNFAADIDVLLAEVVRVLS